MIGREFHFHDGKKGAALAIRISRNSKIDKIQKILKDGTVLIKLIDRPENIDEFLKKFLAEELGIALDRFDIVAGSEGDDRLLSILDIDPDGLQELILSKIL